MSGRNIHQTKQIRIGIVCSPWLGGSGVVGSELARYLAQTEKYQVVFIGTELPFRIDEGQVKFHRVETVKHALFNNPLNETALTEGIVQSVLIYDLQIIHAHFAIPFAYCALQAREVLRRIGIQIKVVTTLHGTDVLTLGQQTPSVMKYVLEQSDSLTAVSHDLAKRTSRLYRTKADIQVVYNFIDLTQTTQAGDLRSLRKKYAPNDERIFVHISNFRPIKRVDDTIKVFLKVNKKLPSILLLIGEGPELSTIKRMTQSRNSKFSIHFIGRVKDPYKYLRIADGLIVTSEYESFCLAALEALRFGVPVFCTRVGGIPEVIKHQRSGYLVKVGDTYRLANLIIQHFTGANKLAPFRQRAGYAASQFSADKIIPQYMKIYHRLLSPRRSTATTLINYSKIR